MESLTEGATPGELRRRILEDGKTASRQRDGARRQAASAEAADAKLAAVLEEAVAAGLWGDVLRVAVLMWALLGLVVSVGTLSECPATVCLPPASLEVSYVASRLPLLPLTATVCTLAGGASPGEDGSAGVSGLVLHMLCGATVSTPLLVVVYVLLSAWHTVEQFANVHASVGEGATTRVVAVGGG